MKKSLDELLQHPSIWQASRAYRPRRAIATGFVSLNESLHDGGWPEAATSELLCEQTGIGELRLLLPALKQVQKQKSLVAFLAPPHLPYAPALKAAGLNPQQVLVVSPHSAREWLWCADQILRSGACGGLVSWGLQTAIGNRDLRMLQQAAHQGDCWHALFRHSREARQASPSALRLELSSDQQHAGHLHIHVLKQRGGWGGQSLSLTLGDKLHKHSAQALKQQAVHLAPLPSLRDRTQRNSATIRAIG